jgi:hypothetical protein
MSPFQKQLDREAGWDTRVVIVLGALFLVFGLLLPRDWFVFWFVPWVSFWFRYLWVRLRRDEELEALLNADLAANGGSSAPGCYASEAGICISDGTHQVLIPRQKPQALLQLPHIVRDK